MPSAISCSLLSTLLFLGLEAYCLIKILRHTGSSISTEKLVPPCHACCVLSRLCCNGHSLLLSSYLSRIGTIENLSCSACGSSFQDTSHLIAHCPATDSASLALWRPLVQALESYPASGAPWSSATPSSLGRGLVTRTKTSMILGTLARSYNFCHNT